MLRNLSSKWFDSCMATEHVGGGNLRIAHIASPPIGARRETPDRKALWRGAARLEKACARDDDDENKPPHTDHTTVCAFGARVCVTQEGSCERERAARSREEARDSRVLFPFKKESPRPGQKSHAAAARLPSPARSPADGIKVRGRGSDDDEDEDEDEDEARARAQGPARTLGARRTRIVLGRRMDTAQPAELLRPLRRRSRRGLTRHLDAARRRRPQTTPREREREESGDSFVVFIQAPDGGQRASTVPARRRRRERTRSSDDDARSRSAPRKGPPRSQKERDDAAVGANLRALLRVVRTCLSERRWSS